MLTVLSFLSPPFIGISNRFIFLFTALKQLQKHLEQKPERKNNYRVRKLYGSDGERERKLSFILLRDEVGNNIHLIFLTFIFEHIKPIEG